jgi:hypothetical protein
MQIRRRVVAVLIGAVAAATVAGPAHAFRAAAGPAAPDQTPNGPAVWLDIADADVLQRTLGRLGIAVAPAQARCLATSYALSGQPRSFRLPAGATDEVRALLGGFGMVVWRGPRDGATVPALAAAASACGVGV